jgi:signal transduction histidine kinase
LDAEVTFALNDGHILLTISDGGAGFDENKAANGQGGLLNVRNRLGLMGCQVKIKSSPGKGTQVMIEIPNLQEK